MKSSRKESLATERGCILALLKTADRLSVDMPEEDWSNSQSTFQVTHAPRVMARSEQAL
jgi:hypothetical protein